MTKPKQLPVTPSAKKGAPPLLYLPTASLRPNPQNPRTITKGKLAQLVKSLRDFPQMLELRPLVIVSQEEPVVLGGNMRLQAAKELGLPLLPCIAAGDLTPEQRARFVIQDNLAFGDWDWEALANEWDAAELADWGLDFPGAEEPKAQQDKPPALKILFSSEQEAEEARQPLEGYLLANFPKAVIK